MPQIPYTGQPQIAPNYQPTPTVHPNVNPNAFGAATAEATSRMGATLGQAGNELFTRALAMQELDQQADADNAHSAASDKVGQAVMDFRTLSGKAAKDAYEPFVQNIDSIIDKEGEGLTSEYAKKLYRTQTSRLRQYTIESAGAHAGNEFKNYQIGTQQARVNNAVSLASLHPEDDSAFKQSLEEIDSSAGMMGQLKGWSPEQVQDYLNTSKSKAVFERATNLARTDPQAAQRVLDSAVKDGYISGEEAGRAGSFIRTQRNQVMTRVESGKLLSGDGAKFGEGIVTANRAREAIAQIESSGNYNPPHPTVTKGQYAGQHALGRYGVMQGNLTPWLKEAGMPSMTEEEFLTDHAAQDKLFDFKFGQLMSQYKSANKAAMVWFTGSPDPDPKSNDGHTSAPNYLQKFNANLAKSATSGEIESVAVAHAETLAPNDSEFHYTFRDRVLAEHSRDAAITREAEFNDRHTVEAALGPAPDGKLPSSIEEIQDPAVHAAWDRLPEYLRTRYDKVFAANAKNDYAPTAENQQEFRTWMGRLTDGMASEDDRKAALDADFISMKMPAAQRQQLIQAQAKMFKQGYKNPKLEHAMSVLQTQLFNAGVTRKGDEEGYFQFRGTLHDILQQRLEDGKYPDDKEIKEIGAGLLRESITSPGWIWDSTGPAFKVSVPDGESTKIKQLFLDFKGREPTEQEIQQVYAVSQFNQFYAKKPKAEAK